MGYEQVFLPLYDKSSGPWFLKYNNKLSRWDEQKVPEKQTDYRMMVALISHSRHVIK